VEKAISRERKLPSIEERRQILLQAGLVLAEARALVEDLDQRTGCPVWAMPSNAAPHNSRRLDSASILFSG